MNWPRHCRSSQSCNCVWSSRPRVLPKASRAGSLPQVDPRRTQILRALKIPVGASLLAKRSSQSTSLAPDPPPSRASSLPQVDPRRAQRLCALKVIVGASLLAKRSSQSTSLAPDPPPSTG
ncbi:hypothetical protein C1X64_23330 [Pseudomonas sp. GW456-E7]|nr:hypothetical protein C1X64_23330 [Pseudomonas sp. GW456-E7]